MVTSTCVTSGKHTRETSLLKDLTDNCTLYMSAISLYCVKCVIHRWLMQNTAAHHTAADMQLSMGCKKWHFVHCICCHTYTLYTIHSHTLTHTLCTHVVTHSHIYFVHYTCWHTHTHTCRNKHILCTTHVVTHSLSLLYCTQCTLSHTHILYAMQHRLSLSYKHSHMYKIV